MIAMPTLRSRRALIRVRNNLPLILVALATAGGGWLIVERLARLGGRLARALL